MTTRPRIRITNRNRGHLSESGVDSPHSTPERERMKYLLIGQEPTDHLMIYPFRAKNRVSADLIAADIARDQEYTHSVLVAARDVPTLIQTMSTLIVEVKSFEKPNRQRKG